MLARHVGDPGFSLRYHKINKGRKRKVSLLFVLLDASPLNCFMPLCLHKHTPFPAMQGILSAPEHGSELKLSSTSRLSDLERVCFAS